MNGYLLDEHLPSSWRARIASDLQVDVWMVGDPAAPPKGTPDPDVLAWCEDYGFILITRDRRTMPGHLQTHLAGGGHVPGVFILRPDMGLRSTLAELRLVAAAALPGELGDGLWCLPFQ